MINRSFLKILAAGIFLLLFTGSSYGQVVKGSISGAIIDSTGARIPGADIKAVEPANGATASTVSGGDGAFRLQLLSTGSYNLTITKEGFKTTEVTSVGVTSAHDTGLGELKLEVGQQSISVEV